MSADGTHRARGVLPRGPIAGLLGLLLFTPSLFLILVSVFLVVFLVPPVGALAVALCATAIGVCALRRATVVRTTSNRWAAVAGLILMVIAAAVAILETLALLN